MYTRSILLYLGALAWLTQGAPLNINLGAYSPALVVEGVAGRPAEGGAGGAEGGAGAGEGGAGGAGEGGAGGAGEGGAGGAGEGGAAGGEGGGGAAAPEASTISAAQDVSALQGMGKQRLP
ncbi:hypothetical protein KVR01_009992 [Diaporthe batatas]|uniref:uncharacterized protein n=1 Tax=Diaporthe batatas TaxID=748121 RepID=UPI001D0537C5|nr:uncharacterized protein KVR01_009992 [Diaporthe batatas]KAG8160456.1 hypothetical protein KVR01_009992 [Diaporthe batatas]